MMIIRPSRRKPAVGDLFVVNMLGRQWVAGRVIRTDAFGLAPGRDILVYFYKRAVLDPENIQTPLKPDLVIPPVMTNTLCWKRGFFAHIRNEPLMPEELLSRHVFQNNVHATTDPRRFQDEYWRTVPPPEPGLPCGPCGLFGYGGIDCQLCKGLGIPWGFDRKPAPTLESGRTSENLDDQEDSQSYEVILNVPPGSSETLDMDDLEEDLTEALERAKAGKWEGHGTDLRTGMFDTRFYGPDHERMIEAMRPVLERISRRLPAGWYLTVGRAGSDNAHRVEL